MDGYSRLEEGLRRVLRGKMTLKLMVGYLSKRYPKSSAVKVPQAILHDLPSHPELWLVNGRLHRNRNTLELDRAMPTSITVPTNDLILPLTGCYSL